MNDRSASPQEQQFEDELRAEHNRYVEELRAALDLDAGLDDVFSRAENAEYIKRLRGGDVLDVEGGLAAALATVEDPDPNQDDGADEEKPSGRSTATTPPTLVTRTIDSENKPVETSTSKQDDNDSGSIFDKIDQLRASLASKKMRGVYKSKSLQAATGHLDSLHRRLRNHQVSRSQAHEMLKKAETSLVEKTMREWIISAILLSTAGLIASTKDQIRGYYFYFCYHVIDGYLFWRNTVWMLPLLMVITIASAGIGGIILPIRIRRRRGEKVVSWQRAFKQLHGDIDRLFDPSDDYSNAVTNP